MLAKAGLEPKPGDLDTFGDLLKQYREALKALQALDLGDEEMAPVFRPTGPGQ